MKTHSSKTPTKPRKATPAQAQQPQAPEECAYCHQTVTQTSCRADHPAGYLCTRPAGHAGPHVACSSRDHMLKVWDQAAPAPAPDAAAYHTASQLATLAQHAHKLAEDLDELANAPSYQAPLQHIIISHGSTAEDIWDDLIMVFDLPADTRTVTLDARILDVKRFE